MINMINIINMINMNPCRNVGIRDESGAIVV